ncbi:hypothetical protein PDIG_67230 [Penicillium digitatum PHI26]|uniref:Uncharacterized protein n=2 Tax=Penicillium digitatum TaxID=36651 RepID=K9FI09_PEND2|nr:hypothetical protein PDIP_76530 [Penicillium digitatum Pd1]EKV06832.1 hypothetical protein PDIP_76530 [Penicillium digitatum Pd1]EKV08859.1 hypothetical protein PDIG_67230 [Penicillium digitatum PHI26]
MCDVPFFPIFPICFQCGTDQNPCNCKVIGPTLGKFGSSVVCYPLSIFCGCGCTQTGKEYVLPSCTSLIPRLTNSSMLGYPVKLNRKVSDAIPI